MEPTISTSDIIFGKDVPEGVLELGTIVTFAVKTYDGYYLNTHRIIGYYCSYEDGTDTKYEKLYLGDVSSYEDLVSKYPSYTLLGYVTRGDKYTLENGATIEDPRIWKENEDGEKYVVTSKDDPGYLSIAENEVLAVWKGGKIGFVGKLGYARDIDLGKRKDLRPHIKAQKIFAVISELALHLCALRVGAVHIISLKIIRRECGHLKISVSINGSYIGVGRGHFGNGDALYRTADKRALGGVIIKKDESIRAKIHLMRYCRDVSVLGVPIGLYRDKIVRAKYALGVIESRYCVFVIVFRGNSEHNAKRRELFKIFLEFLKALGLGSFPAYLDTVNAIVAHDAAPEGVIKVNGDGLFIFAENRFYNS